MAIEQHFHPISKRELNGQRINPGEKVPEGALYDGADGYWKLYPYVGDILAESAEAIVVLPASLTDPDLYDQWKAGGRGTRESEKP